MSQRRNVREAIEPAILDAFVRNTQMNLITLTAFREGADEGEGTTFACVARRPREAIRLLWERLGDNSPYSRVDVEEVVFTAPMNGPSQVRGPLGARAFTWLQAV